ncbi:hypothetical protein [Saccharolobus islandicus]|jgi:hypothetical protein|uniref:Uncharacterized protein n=5 Tax=Saccharolobus islandicus TaxID=43080 RepID=M9UGX5_SACIS|nr:hypothetical protein [Sulfolobus islandicus]ACP49876.1 hypothetical protein YN1551_2989 [Sulfolobus islandicus Y.N.15.51]ADB88539.1 hypothetical protein LD85_2944 [Sulfolobus islandicus L.D.8.5]ADX83907.1 hypothetical protein SiH_2570 [Sulfolobus islandicus HVE10/4]ADX86559.1 conserved hypothetical protein [Sulfolobus islandicus REY15A]AGJ63901.1 Hypothetical Protein SiL_2465 [Sulfolobus islandicus LAL14/1]
MSSRKIIPTRLPVIWGNENLPGLPQISPTAYEEIMLRCKTCNQIVSVSKALEHQLMHKNKGEEACFTVETSQPKRIWYSNEII